MHAYICVLVKCLKKGQRPFPRVYIQLHNNEKISKFHVNVSKRDLLSRECIDFCLHIALRTKLTTNIACAIQMFRDVCPLFFLCFRLQTLGIVRFIFLYNLTFRKKEFKQPST